MNSKQIFKNQELFSYCFADKEFDSPFQFQIPLNSTFADEIAKDVAEVKESRIDPVKYAEYELSMQVGKQFFYCAFIKVMPYQRRIDFLNYQLSQTKDKVTFLQRVEAFSQVDYWYAYGEHSYYNAAIEKVVADWVIAKYKGDTDPKPLKLIKP